MFSSEIWPLLRYIRFECKALLQSDKRKQKCSGETDNISGISVLEHSARIRSDLNDDTSMDVCMCTCV